MMIYYQLDPKEHISMKLKKLLKKNAYENVVCKNGDHLVLAGIDLHTSLNVFLLHCWHVSFYILFVGLFIYIIVRQVIELFAYFLMHLLLYVMNQILITYSVHQCKFHWPGILFFFCFVFLTFSQIESNNVPFCNRNVNVCIFLLQNGALWDICLRHYGICETGLLSHRWFM